MGIGDYDAFLKTKTKGNTFMNYETAQKKARQKLVNNVTDVRLGEMDLAAWSHTAVGSTQMFRYTHEEFGGSVLEDNANELGCEPVDQDILLVGFVCPNTTDLLTACIFPEDDFVGLDVECADEEDPYLEPLCAMTVVDFFRYLNTLPNYLAFADTRKPMANGTPEGLYLLKKLAGYQ